MAFVRSLVRSRARQSTAKSRNTQNAMQMSIGEQAKSLWNGSYSFYPIPFRCFISFLLFIYFFCAVVVVVVLLLRLQNAVQKSTLECRVPENVFLLSHSLSLSLCFRFHFCYHQRILLRGNERTKKKSHDKGSTIQQSFEFVQKDTQRRKDKTCFIS